MRRAGGVWQRRRAEEWRIGSSPECPLGSTLLLGYDVDARFLPTIVMRRIGGGVMQRYMRRSSLRCTTAVRISIARRIYLYGRGSSCREAIRRTFRGTKEHLCRGMPCVVCATPYAMKHATRCLHTAEIKTWL